MGTRKKKYFFQFEKNEFLISKCDKSLFLQSYMFKLSLIFKNFKM